MMFFGTCSSQINNGSFHNWASSFFALGITTGRCPSRISNGSSHDWASSLCALGIATGTCPSRISNGNSHNWASSPALAFIKLKVMRSRGGSGDWDAQALYATTFPKVCADTQQREPFTSPLSSARKEPQTKSSQDALSSPLRLLE